MRAPLIGLTGRRLSAENVEGFPKVLQGCVLETFIADYAAAVAAAGGLAVLLTPESDVNELVGRLDGVLLSGGADVDPARYGTQIEPGCGTIEPDRDRFELAVLAAAMAAAMPVLGICRGLQMVNVAAGGTLHQHVPNHAALDRPAHSETHEVSIESGSQLADIYSADSRGVNSLHHQVVDEVGGEYSVSARAPDGYVEGLEHNSLPIVAVQWHPEMMTGARHDPLFVWLVEAAREWALVGEVSERCS